MNHIYQRIKILKKSKTRRKPKLTDSDRELELQLSLSNLFLLLFLVDFLILLLTIMPASGLGAFTPFQEFLSELPGEVAAFLTPSADARKAWNALWYADIERKVVV